MQGRVQMAHKKVVRVAASAGAGKQVVLQLVLHDVQLSDEGV